MAGASPELIALSVISDAVVGLFQHANMDIRLGPLNYVFSAAPVHRWHHSRARVEADHNYGDNFIFWDLVFGTYYNAAQREVGGARRGRARGVPAPVPCPAPLAATLAAIVEESQPK